MPIKILRTALLISAVFFFTGCKKETSQKSDQVQTGSYGEKIRSWFESANRSNNFPGRLSGRQVSTNYDPRDGDPEWDKTVYYEDSKLYVTPIKLLFDKTNPDYITCKYLVTEQNNNGDITEGRFQYIVINKEKTEPAFIDLLPGTLPEGIFTNNSFPGSFSGFSVKYDLNYMPISSNEFLKGVINNNIKKVNLLANIGDDFYYIDQPGFLDAVSKAIYKCEDYFWVGFNDAGEIVFVLYSDTQCVQVGDDGSGNGNPATGGGNDGSNPPPPPPPPPTNVNFCSMTPQEAENALNSMYGVEDGVAYFTEGPETVNAVDGRIRKPNNPVQRLVDLHIILNYVAKYSAYFTGWVYKDNENDPWKWESCEYTGTHLEGGQIPPCVEIEPHVSAGKVGFSEDKLNAIVRINYSFIGKITCLGPLNPSEVYSGAHTYYFPAGQEW